MIERLGELGKSKLYWLGLVILALSMEGMALLYQYVGDSMCASGCWCSSSLPCWR